MIQRPGESMPLVDADFASTRLTFRRLPTTGTLFANDTGEYAVVLNSSLVSTLLWFQWHDSAFQSVGDLESGDSFDLVYEKTGGIVEFQLPLTDLFVASVVQTDSGESGHPLELSASFLGQTEGEAIVSNSQQNVVHLATAVVAMVLHL